MVNGFVFKQLQSTTLSLILHSAIGRWHISVSGWSQGEVRLQRTSHGSQGQVGGTPWTTDSRGSEPGSLRWSDARSGPLWPLMLDELCLIEMHKRWRRTPGGGCVPDCPGQCLGIIDTATGHHWCKEWTNYSIWQWLKRTESVAIAWTKMISQLLRRHLFIVTAVSIH